jgi:hypothetical protein
MAASSDPRYDERRAVEINMRDCREPARTDWEEWPNIDASQGLNP